MGVSVQPRNPHLTGPSVAIVSSAIHADPDSAAHSFVYEEARLLARAGVTIHVVTPRVHRVSTVDGMTFHPVRPRVDRDIAGALMSMVSTYPRRSLVKSPVRTLAECAYGARVGRVVRMERLDLIHAHFAYIEGAAGLLAKGITRRPLIVSVHGYDILLEKGAAYGIRRRRAFDLLVRTVLRQADAIVAASQYMQRKALEVLGSAETVRLIPNAVDLAKFSEAIETVQRHSERKIVFALRAHKPQHGLEYLIRAIPRVLQSCPDAHFVVGGDGPLRPSLQRLSADLGIGDHIEFTGTIRGRLLPGYYQRCDLVVVPSIVEAFGMVVAEAMACGKPVVASRVGGILDQVVDGYNGFLVPPANAEELADKILAVLQNDDLARRMGANGRRLAERRFDLRDKVARLCELYNEVIAKH